EDVPTKLRQCLIAFSILDSAQPMNSTIKLDSETRLKNRKIRYVSANRMLSPHVNAFGAHES
ncbi:MAG TPA: hypothetical protein VG735_06425, partial [Caulobacterales bacterium]|nr:hypothetical protein [Caulobacterales bacterium]